jgi:general L-amino acid transport system permease protein
MSQTTIDPRSLRAPPRRPLRLSWSDERVRGIVWQILVVGFIGAIVWWLWSNTVHNLEVRRIATGFGFLGREAGLPIAESVIEYSPTDTYLRALTVGLLNTLKVAVVGIILATVLGTLVGIARLSKNWLLAKIAAVYVEVIRDLPLLLQLLFWYNAVLKALPSVRDSAQLPFGIFLNNRGMFAPRPDPEPAFDFVWLSLAVGVAGAIAYRIWARKRQEKTGQQAPVGWVTLGLVIGLPLVVFFLSGRPLTFDYPQATRFNIAGGMVIQPEFLALLFGLTIYTGAFITEVVRAGILAVSHGQTEAAFALGLKPRTTTKLIIIPQAMRVIIPPLTSQYLNLTKNSSLAVFVGYPDLANVFTGTVLNQTGQAIEVVVMTMGVYLLISLVTSFFMNIYNRRVAIVER